MNFKTIKVPNNQLALFMLSIRAPVPPFLPIEVFVFPISPQRIRKVFTGMGAIYDTAGTPAESGVNRDADKYGMTPFTYEIEGTTGWDLHLTDGFQVPGQIAVQNLQQLFYDYASYNSIQQAINNPYDYTMEFADFFNGEFYQVEPIGQQEIRASDRAPLLQYYRLRLVGIQPVSTPLIDVQLGPIDITLSAAPTSMLGATLTLTTSVLGIY